MNLKEISTNENIKRAVIKTHDIPQVLGNRIENFVTAQTAVFFL